MPSSEPTVGAAPKVVKSILKRRGRFAKMHAMMRVGYTFRSREEAAKFFAKGAQCSVSAATDFDTEEMESLARIARVEGLVKTLHPKGLRALRNI